MFPFSSLGLIAVLVLLCGVDAAAVDPGARLIISTSTTVDPSEFTEVIGVMVNADASIVNLGGIVPLDAQNVQADFGFKDGAGRTAMQYLTDFQTTMQDPSSEGYKVLTVYYDLVSYEIYGLASTTTPAPTQTPKRVDFSFAIMLKNSNEQVDTNTFATLVAAVVSVPSSRVAVKSANYYDYVYVNMTATFTANTTLTDGYPPDLVAQLRTAMTADAPSAAVTALKNTYTIQNAEYTGFTPRIPLIIITVTGTPKRDEVLASAASAVGVSNARVKGGTVSVSNGVMNVSFTFTDGLPTAWDLTVALQKAFRDTSSSSFVNYLAQYQSPSQYFEGLPALPPLTTAPIVNRDIEWRVRRGAPITNASFTTDIANALGVPTARVMMLVNSYNNAGSTTRFVFTFTEEEDDTPQSRYNLSYSVMAMRFNRASDAKYLLYLTLYDVTYENYGDWIVMMTEAPKETNPTITLSMSVSQLNIDAFRQSLASTVGTTVERIDSLNLVNSNGLFNYTFKFMEPATSADEGGFTNPSDTKPASDLATYVYLLLTYRRDEGYFSYLEKYNIISMSFPNYEPPTIPSTHRVSIIMFMSIRSISWHIDEATGANITDEWAYVNTDLETFKADFSELVLAKSRRLTFEDPASRTEGGREGVYFRYMPVADPSLPSPRQLTLNLQNSLATRTGPNIVTIFSRYNISDRRYDGLTDVTDAPPTTTRNPYLPPDPNFYSPYGPNFNRTGMTESPALDDGTSKNNGLLYGIVFGILGALVVAGGVTVLVKVILSRKNGGGSKKPTSYGSQV